MSSPAAKERIFQAVSVRFQCKLCVFGTQLKKILMGKQAFPWEEAAHHATILTQLPLERARPVELYRSIADNKLSVSRCCILCDFHMILALGQWNLAAPYHYTIAVCSVSPTTHIDCFDQLRSLIDVIVKSVLLIKRKKSIPMCGCACGTTSKYLTNAKQID